MRTSASQFELMVSFMEEHGDLIKPSSNASGRLRHIMKWEELTNLLNGDGSGDTKPTDKWKKVWSDFKNNTKKKAARLHKAAMGTGGGPAVFSKLTELEQRLLKIVGLQIATGLPAEEAGFSQNPQSIQQDSETISSLQPVNKTFQAVNDESESNISDDEESKHSPLEVYNTEPSSIDAASHVPSGDDEPIEYSDPLLEGYADVLSPVKGPTNFGPSRDSLRNRRRHILKSMRRTSLKMPYERVAKEFAVAESQRLKLENDRERRLHEIELRRLELDTLRENNLHAREAARAQIDRDTIKIQQEFLALLKEAIYKFSVKQ